uniref:Uncharacterized protein n=1 Tax=Anguilla anguilla TaxID=7936 RepID=A0A0E9QP04_ANGAN
MHRCNMTVKVVRRLKYVVTMRGAVTPLAWSLSSRLAPLFHSSICSCKGLIRQSMKAL